MRSPARARRRRTEPRRADASLLDKGLQILELLAHRPAGLTVIEIAGSLDCAPAELTGAIAILQRRRWLRAIGQAEAITLGDRLHELSEAPTS